MQKTTFIESLSLLKNLLMVNGQIIHGMLKITRLPKPRVSIFGGHISKLADYAHKAHALSYSLIRADISVLTGGGPGMMEAANCGASHFDTSKTRARTLGISVSGLETEAFNPCVGEKGIITSYFFARKWLLMYYSDVFIFFPGGIGTIDELTEVLTLTQTKKLPITPIILFGKEYWQPLIEWLNNVVIHSGMAFAQDIEAIIITDDVDEALALIKKHCNNIHKKVKE